jgi:hypothetical protein
MMSYDTDTAGCFELKRLPTLTPDPGRAERVRMRCRAQLGQRLKREERKERIRALGRRVLTPVIVGGFCILYLAALVAATLRLHGLLH